MSPFISASKRQFIFEVGLSNSDATANGSFNIFRKKTFGFVGDWGCSLQISADLDDGLDWHRLSAMV